MANTAATPLRRKQIAREVLANRKLRDDIRRNLNTPPECKCECHRGRADAHVGSKCPCKAARRRLIP